MVWHTRLSFTMFRSLSCQVSWDTMHEWHRGLCDYQLLVSRSVISDSSRTRGVQHARLPCPSPFLTVGSTHVLWVGEAIQPSRPVIPLSSCLQSFPASGSFLMSQLFASGGQNIGASASASVLPMNIQGWFSLGLTCFILQSKHSQESSPTPQFKGINSLTLSLLYGPILTSIPDYWTISDYHQIIRRETVCLHLTETDDLFNGTPCISVLGLL